MAETGAVTTSKIADGTIVNADVSPSAAIGTGKTADTFKTQTQAETQVDALVFKE